MSAGNLNNNGFSAAVRMQLKMNGHVFAIGQRGPDFLILRDAVDCPPGDEEMTVSIDGDLRRWSVQLPDAIAANVPPTKMSKYAGTRNGCTAD